MALRNAFGEIGLEQTLRHILRAVSYARDINDRMRVIVDNQVSVQVWQGNQNNNIGANNIPPYHTGSWNVYDARDTAANATILNFETNRGRWTIT